MNAYIRSQKFTLGDIISEGWRIYFAKFWTVLKVLLCVYIPIEIIRAFVLVYSARTPDGSWSQILILYIGSILISLIGLIATIVIAFIVEKEYQNQDISWTQVLRHGFSRWGSAIGTSILGGIIVMLLSLLLIIPGIIWSIYYFFFFYVVALRNIGGKKALDYSKDLVKGQWWSVFGIGFLIGVLNYILVYVISLIYKFVPGSLITSLFGNLVIEFIDALFITMIAAWFLNVDYLKHPAPYMQTSITPAAELAQPELQPGPVTSEPAASHDAVEHQDVVPEAIPPEAVV